MATVKSRRGRRGKVLAEINIAPFTDVVLVLLIIFMTMTPILSSQRSAGAGRAAQAEQAAGDSKEEGFNVDLPKANKANQIQSLASQLIVVVFSDGRTAVKGQVLNEEDLTRELTQIKQKNPQTLVIIQADRMVNHWRVVRVMNLATEVGLNRLAIATVEG